MKLTTTLLMIWLGAFAGVAAGAGTTMSAPPDPEYCARRDADPENCERVKNNNRGPINSRTAGNIITICFNDVSYIPGRAVIYFPVTPSM